MNVVKQKEADELAGAAGYRECALEFNLEKLAPLSFHVMQFNRARLRLDRIEIARLSPAEAVAR